jgi:ATP-binding protein involved in chromosome partitioning
VPLLGSVPIDPRLREGGDIGVPIVLAQPESPAAVALLAIAQEIGGRPRSLVGKPLTLTPVS